MEKQERVKNALLCKPVDEIPVFMSGTPQFFRKVAEQHHFEEDSLLNWEYCNYLNLDVVQLGHGSFYPVNMNLAKGTLYRDEFQRTHIVTDYYDEFCVPFPLQSSNKLNISELKEKWDKFRFPDPSLSKWIEPVSLVVKKNQELTDPLHVWGVINGPFEPTWQLLSDHWVNFFILAKRDFELAKELIHKVADYCIAAGTKLIDAGVNAIRIGDDYAINEGLMCAPTLWKELIYPEQKRLVAGLKKEGGSDFPIILHSDGNLTEILSLLKQSGIDGLNPIQPGALDFEDVINKVGDRLSLVGAFDLTYFLNQLTEETRIAIKNEFNRLKTIVSNYNAKIKRDRLAGFCIGPTHQLQPKTFVETFEFFVSLVHESHISD